MIVFITFINQINTSNKITPIVRTSQDNICLVIISYRRFYLLNPNSTQISNA